MVPRSISKKKCERTVCPSFLNCSANIASGWMYICALLPFTCTCTGHLPGIGDNRVFSGARSNSFSNGMSFTSPRARHASSRLMRKVETASVWSRLSRV